MEERWLKLSLSKLKAWIDPLAKLVAIAAVVLAYHEWRESRSDLRVARTFEYVEQFNDPGSHIGAAKLGISEVLWDNAEQIKRLKVLYERLPPEMAKKLRSKFEMKLFFSDNGRDLKADINTLIQFFDSLGVCIDEGLCASDPAEAFFGEYASDLWGNFYRTICKDRSIAPGYGTGLEKSANSTLSCST